MDKRIYNGLSPHFENSKNEYGDWVWHANTGEKRNVRSCIYDIGLRGLRESGYILVRTYIEYTTLEYVLIVSGMATKNDCVIDKQQFVIRQRMDYQESAKNHEALLKWAKEKLEEIYSIFYYV